MPAWRRATTPEKFWGMGTGSPFVAVMVMRSRPAVSLPSGFAGMTTSFYRRTARRICIAYSARLNERRAAASYVARISPAVKLVNGCAQSDIAHPRPDWFHARRLDCNKIV